MRWVSKSHYHVTLPLIKMVADFFSFRIFILKAKIMCSSICKCIGCKNFEESPERKTLMHLADAAEVRVQQQTAAKTKLSSQISDLLTRTTPVISSGGGRYQSARLHVAIRKNCVIISTKVLHELFFFLALFTLT